jgi:hypothetical protein
LQKALVLLAILASGLLMGHFELRMDHAARIGPAASVPTSFVLFAFFNGWNSSATGSSCSPSGSSSCNPSVTEFRGVAFTATIKWGGATEPQHDFAIYTSDITPDLVSFTDFCSLTAQSGCLKASRPVSSTAQTVLLSFIPAIPKDGPPFDGPGVYNYYCQFHPGMMNGKIQVFKNPDVNLDHSVNIVDLATVAFSFGATPTSSTWNLSRSISGT